MVKVAVQRSDLGQLKLTSSETPTACNGKIHINNLMKDDENISKGDDVHNGDANYLSEGMML